jgi:hypothetical protein
LSGAIERTSKTSKAKQKSAVVSGVEQWRALVPGKKSSVNSRSESMSSSDVDRNDYQDTELTELDGISISSSHNSSASSVDLGPRPLPPDLRPDDRLTRPEAWLRRLESLEEEIVNASEIKRLHSTIPPEIPDIETYTKLIDNVIKQLDRMETEEYCNGSFNAVVADTERDAVASLVRIDQEKIITLKTAIAGSDLQSCLQVLRDFSLDATCRRIKETPSNEQLRTAAALATHFLDFAVVSFCSAHVGLFDEVYLGGKKSEFIIQPGLIVRRRSLRCLDAYFHERQVWVFEELAPSSSFRSQDSLYLSTTMEEFNNIWGPVWITLREPKNKRKDGMDVQQEVVQFNVGLGYIIPWKHTPHEPRPQVDEIFSHWTTDEADLYGTSSFPANSQAIKLLIGSGSRLSKNNKCSMTQNDCTLKLREQSSLHHYNARRPVKERHSQTVSLSVSGGGVQAGYGEEWRIREGSMLKECLLATWLNNPSERNPSIMAHWIGVEISGCTGNARRRRLCRILASQSMRNYLDSVVMDWEDDEECKRLYFEALSNQNIRAFENLYIDASKERREKIGTAVAISLRVLFKSGLDRDQRLCAIWSPNSRDTYKATLTNRRWAGILGDTIESCAVVILTPDCLQFKRNVEWASNCHSISDEDGEEGQGQSTVLETAMVVNGKAKIPKRLVLEERRWSVEQLRPNDGFDLGDSGLLKVLGLFHRTRGVMMRWTSAHMGREMTESFRERILKKNRRPCNWERVMCTEETVEPILIHVASHW